MADRRRDDDEDRPRRGRDDDDRRERRGRDDDDRGRDRESRGRDRDDDREERGSRRGREDDDDRGGSGFRYERRDPSEAKRRAEGNSDYDKFVKDGIKNFKPRDGDNRIRILPPTWKGAKHYGVDLKVHYGVGADRQSYLCLHGMKGEDDPIYEAYQRARAELNDDEDNKELKEHVGQLKAKNRTGVYLVDRDDEKAGVQFWAMPASLDQDIVMVMQDKRTGEVLPIDDPDEGYDVEFVKKGKLRNTEYTGVAIARRSSPLGDSKWLKFAVENPIPDQLVYYPYEHIAKQFGGAGAKRKRDEDEDQRPTRDDRQREEGRSRPARDDHREERGRGRDDDDRGRGRSREAEDDYTWEKIHDMTKSELEDLVEEKDLDVKPKQAKDVEDLADWVCEEMKIKKPERKPSRRDDDSGDDKLAEMRRRRERD